MFWTVVALVYSVLLYLFTLRGLLNHEKDLDILIPRHQRDNLEHKQTHPIKASKVERLTLAILTDKLKTMSNQCTGQLRRVVHLFQPETILKWHRELVRRNWTYEQKNKGGRPKINKGKENFIVRLATGNICWGYAILKVN